MRTSRVLLGLLVASLAVSAPDALHASTAPASAAEPTRDPPPVPLARVASFTRDGSLVALARADGADLALVSDPDGNAVRVIDLARGAELSARAVSGPAQLVVLRDGRVALAARGEDAVIVLALDGARALRESARWPAPRGPVALALSPDDDTLFVAGTDDAQLAAIRVADGAVTMRAPTRAMPRALTVTSNGARVLVAHAASSEVLSIDAQSGRAHVESLDATLLDIAPLGEEMREVPARGQKPGPWTFANGMGTNWAREARAKIPVRARHSYAFARAGERVLVAHEAMLPSVPPTETGESPASGYGGVDQLGARFFAVSALDVASGAKRDVRPTEVGCALPRASAYDADSETLFVACEGDDTLVAMRLDAQVRGRTLDAGGTEKVLIRRMGGPTFTQRARMSLCAGPAGIALDREKARVVVACDRCADLVVVPLTASKRLGTPTYIPYARPDAMDPAVFAGRALFFAADARVSSDGRACATCHVEGLADGLVWTTPDGPRSPPVLAGRVDRAGPFGWRGEHATFAAHVKRTIRVNLHGRGLDDDALDALRAYLASLPAPRGTSDPLAARGRDVFRAQQCDGCHAGALSSDGERHTLGRGGAFLTPSLVGLARSAPYFHDGRYASLDALLAGTAGAMGDTRGLDAADRAALVAYLRSL